MLAVGDVCVSNLPEGNISSETSGDIYQNGVLEVLHDKDISLANLECPLTTINNPISKSGPSISAFPDAIEALTLAKFDVAVLANNHIMDHGEAALRETISVCERAGLKTVGAGDNLEAAYCPLFVELKGLRIAFLAFAEEEFSCATETTPGTAKLDLAAAGSVIRQTKKKSDLVIVNVHGGNEFYPIPSPRMQKWYRLLVECGADAIIGHHPHTLQGVEIYKNAPILYSLGNFIFPYELKQPKCWYQGLMVKLIIADGKVSALEIFSSEQIVSNGKVRIELLKEAEEASFLKRLDRLSQIASDLTLVREFWKCFCSYKKRFYLNVLKMAATGLKPDLKGLAKRAIKNGNISYLPCILADFIDYLCQKKSVRDRKIAELKNLLFCPAHHEVLSTIIEMEMLGQTPSDETWHEFKELMVYCNQRQ